MLLDRIPPRKQARLCGRPQKTVEAQVYRAKKMLAAQLRGQWGGSPAETGKEEPEWMKKNWNCSGRTDA